MDVRPLVSDDGSRVSRRLYYDEALYRLEQSRVFGRAWLFLGHISQLSEANDYFLTYMGEESVLVSRSREGVIGAHLNTCRHRGLRVCRADAGNAPSFTCPYHGWTYGSDGSLRGLPREKELYPEIDKSAWGLIAVPRVESYRGLIFGCFDANAEPLDEHLGDMRFYLDSAFARTEGGTIILGGVQKWRVKTNWKMPAENMVGDVFHAPTSHETAFALQKMAGQSGFEDLENHGYNVACGKGHGITTRLYPEGSKEWMMIPGDGQFSRMPETKGYFAGKLEEARERLGPVGVRTKGATLTVFPNFSCLPSVMSFRVGHPRGPTETEIWSWVFVDAEAPPETRAAIRKAYTGIFGPGGILEQDDGENWEEVTRGAAGLHADGHPFHLGMGMGTEGAHDELPGLVGPITSEHPQRHFYRHWRDLMESEG